MENCHASSRPKGQVTIPKHIREREGIAAGHRGWRSSRARAMTIVLRKATAEAERGAARTKGWSRPTSSACAEASTIGMSTDEYHGADCAANERHARRLQRPDRYPRRRSGLGGVVARHACEVARRADAIWSSIRSIYAEICAGYPTRARMTIRLSARSIYRRENLPWEAAFNAGTRLSGLSPSRRHEAFSAAGFLHRRACRG